MITTYTTYDEVRATLGVSNEEIEDTTLALPIWSTNLDFSLDEFSTALVSTYEAIAAKAENTRTAVEKKIYAGTRLFATYTVADDLLKSLPMFSFKRLTDGKAEAERFDAWKDTKSGVQAGLSAIKLRLQLALSGTSGYTAPLRNTFRFTSATGLATDPVTE